MKKEILLYYPLYDFVVGDIMAQLAEFSSDDITLRVNCPGGSVLASYGLYAKIKELGNVNLKVDGSAMSAASFLGLYSKSSECLDVSRFVLHRANMEVDNQEDQDYLDGINKDLLAQLKMKVDPKVFKEITGYTFADLFDPTQRLEIILSGTQAKKIGLVQKVTKLTPEMQSELTAFSKRYSLAAHIETEDTPKKTITMTYEELQTKHPDLFKQAFNAGIAQEKDRVEACLEYLEADAEGVKAAISGGKPLSQKDMAAFNVKMMSAQMLGTIKTDSEKKPLATAEAEKEKTEKVEAFAGDVKNMLKLNKTA